jgi:protein phosphatase 1 regulatory subunit 37
MNIDKKSAEYLVQALNSTPVHPLLSAKSRLAGAGEAPLPDTPTEMRTTAEGEKGKDETEEADDGPRLSRYSSCVPSAPLLREDEGQDLPAAVQTLRMDGCGLRVTVLESLGE